MKEYKIASFDLGKLTLDEAFDIVFSRDTMDQVHQEYTESTPWKDDKHHATFIINVSTLPGPLKHLLDTSKGLNVSIHQTLNKSEKRWTVLNTINLHFIGARMFPLDSMFELYEDENNHIFLSGKVRCRARLLFPLNMLAETFIIRQCKKELDTYTNAVMKSFVK